MRGLTPIDRDILEELAADPGAPYADHDTGPPYNAQQIASCKMLWAEGRITAVLCKACGHLHPVLTAAGHEALKLAKIVGR